MAEQMTKREGPRVTIQKRCSDCKFFRSEKYVCQSDSGFDHYCDHPKIEGRDTGGYATPDWCPYLAVQPAAVDVPTGWKLVPIEPSLNMLDQAFGICGTLLSDGQVNLLLLVEAEEKYKKLLDAAPSPSAGE